MALKFSINIWHSQKDIGNEQLNTLIVVASEERFEIDDQPIIGRFLLPLDKATFFPRPESFRNYYGNNGQFLKSRTIICCLTPD